MKEKYAMNMSGDALRVENITKRYGDFVAVEGVSFTVPRGIIFGLLGPNGAGKTTSIRMIMNITIPDSGSVTILGKSSTEGASRLIGYLPEERGLYRKMKVFDHVVFLGEIRGLDNKRAKEKAAEWITRVGMDDWSKKKVEELSKGMQQKIQFVGCVIHEPEVLILDEPFSGLDPVNARVLKELLLDYRASGRTVIMSTHVMEQAEKLCDEIALINRGKVVLEGKLQDVKRERSGNKLVIEGRGDIEALRPISGVKSVETIEDKTFVELEPNVSTSDFLRSASSKYELESVQRHETSLDEIFVSVVGAEAARPRNPEAAA